MWQQFVPTMLVHWWKSLEQMMWLITNLEIWSNSLKPYLRMCLCCLILRWRSWPSVLLPFDSRLQSVRTPSFPFSFFFPLLKPYLLKQILLCPFFECNLPSIASTDFIVRLSQLIGFMETSLLARASNDHDLISFVSFHCRIWECLKSHE